jgi:hypothetical protein
MWFYQRVQTKWRSEMEHKSVGSEVLTLMVMKILKEHVASTFKVQELAKQKPV